MCIRDRLQNGHRQAGDVNKDLYSYNSGSMILADLLLFDITKDSSYEQDAWQAAHATHEAFLQKNSNGTREYKDFIWFTAIWAEGFAELEKRDASRTTEYREVFEEMLTHGIQNCERFDGLIPHDCARDWRPDEDVYDRLLSVSYTHLALKVWMILIGMLNSSLQRADAQPATCLLYTSRCV